LSGQPGEIPHPIITVDKDIIGFDMNRTTMTKYFVMRTILISGTDEKYLKSNNY